MDEEFEAQRVIEFVSSSVGGNRSNCDQWDSRDSSSEASTLYLYVI